LTSTAWVVVVAAAVTELGFSIEIGGFLAGIALANSSENYSIASEIKPLRDFFILLFFVILGSQLVNVDFADSTDIVSTPASKYLFNFSCTIFSNNL